MEVVSSLKYGRASTVIGLKGFGADLCISSPNWAKDTEMKNIDRNKNNLIIDALWVSKRLLKLSKTLPETYRESKINANQASIILFRVTR
jgi:hypothetical protein